MGDNNEIISVCFSYKHLKLIRKLAKAQGIKPSKLIESVMNEYVINYSKN